MLIVLLKQNTIRYDTMEEFKLNSSIVSNRRVFYSFTKTVNGEIILF